jgi:hypothetical protein
VQEDFVDEIALCVQILHFLSGDVLALLKFENILFTINNLQAFCVCQQLSDVSSPEPSVFTDCLFGLFSVFVVSQKDAVSSDPDLSSWRRSVFLIFVCTQILHFWNVNEFELESGLNKNKKLRLGHQHVL